MKAFSLIELLVVVAIIAILAAIAFPIYQRYIVTAQISNAMVVVNRLHDQLIDIYTTTGSWPTSVPFGGVSNLGNGWTPYNQGNIVDLFWAVSNNNIETQATISGLNANVIPGYVTPDTSNHGNSNNWNIINAVSWMDASGTWRRSCGVWENGNTTMIPVTYLPATCQCQYLKDIYSTGSAAGTTGC